MRSKSVSSRARKSIPRVHGGSRERLLAAGLKEFSEFGLAGARIDRILKDAGCNIRMIYHHFGSKVGLYRAVLEQAYADIRAYEERVDTHANDPVNGLLRILEVTFDYFDRNPQFEGLLRFENSVQGRQLAKSSSISLAFIPMKKAMDTLIRDGQRRGLFGKELTTVQLYTTIAALSRSHLANAYTLSTLLDADLSNRQWIAARRRHCLAVLEAYLRRQETEQTR